MATTALPTTTDTLGRSLTRGAIGGMIAAMVMAMFAMVASLTYQHNGFFTPLFHISSVAGSSTAMMTSMQQAMGGHNFWFTPGAAMVGMIIHLITGAAYGMMFAAIARVLPRRAILPAGALYGLAVFAISAWVDLPAAGAITGAGDPIAKMATMVGYPTFAIEHIMYGVALAAFILLTTASTSPSTTSDVTTRSTVNA